MSEHLRGFMKQILLLIFVGLSLLGFEAFSNDENQNNAVRNEVAKVIEFWENKNHSTMRTEKIAYWNEIDAALSGTVSDSLMERVTKSWQGARSWHKFYVAWKGVYETLSARKAVQDQQETAEVEPPVVDEPVVVAVLIPVTPPASGGGSFLKLIFSLVYIHSI